MIGWVMANRMPRIAADVDDEFYDLKSDLLPETRTEATLPILIADKLLGVLDIQHTAPHAFDSDAVAVLQTIANHVATVIQNFRLLEATQNSLEELSGLYYASYQLARASLPHEVIQVVSDTLERSPYFTALFFVERGALRLVI
jgi:GAF domain-containing protein